MRKPAGILAFLGVAPGQQVLDAFSAGGYYTELLSRVVGADGGVIAYNNPPYAKFAEKGIAARYADDRLPNVRQVTAEVDELELPPRSLDAALFVMSYHDMYWRPADRSWARTDPMQMLRKLHAGMKVGGVVVVQDHVAAPGGDVAEVVDKLHNAMFHIKNATEQSFAGELLLPFKCWVAFPRISREEWISEGRFSRGV